MLFDERTNHLDIEAREALIINKFSASLNHYLNQIINLYNHGLSAIIISILLYSIKIIHLNQKVVIYLHMIFRLD